MSFPAGALLLLTAIGAAPDLRIVGLPRIEGLRAIQAQYSPDGGLVFLEWRVEDGEFKSLLIATEGLAQRELPGDARGAQLIQIPVGPRRFSVVGIWDGPEVLAEVELEVLAASQVEPPIFYHCLYFGYDMSTHRGNLQISWEYPQRLEDPYRELEIIIDDKIDGKENPDRIFYRLLAPDTAVTFSRIAEGLHTVTLTGITESYASEPVTVQCWAEWVPPPTEVRIHSACQGDLPGARITYRVPWGVQYSSVAAWATRGEGHRAFLGYFPPQPPEINLSGLEEGPLEVELAGAKFETGADSPYALSNLPGEDCQHAIALGLIRCGPRFRRGDVTGDGPVNLADAISILSHLFLTDEILPCPSAADINDDGGVEITDGVRLLDFLFLGGGPPALPGPAACGSDPTPAEDELCAQDGCAAG